MFDSIAPGYDAFNHLTSLGADRVWRRKALREVVGPRVLDEACGTGDFAIAIAKHLGDLDRKGLNTGKVPDFQGGPGQKKAENCAGPRFSRGTWTEKGQKLCRSQVFGGDLDRKRPKSGKDPGFQGGPGQKKTEIWEGPLQNIGTSTAEISVVGVDISEGMLEVMRRKVEAAGLSGATAMAAEPGPAATEPGVTVHAELGDCCALQFPDSSFDTVTVAFGVRNFEDREKALQEVLRVLRPGGHFVMLELGIPRNPIVRAAYKFYFTRIMPLVGAGISKDKAAYRYLPASVLNFPKPQDWMATMQKAGFAQVRHRPLSLGICNLFTGLRPA